MYSFLLFAFPAKATLPPLSNAQIYTLASRGNVYALRAAVQRGLNIDSIDRRGNTALCHSIIQRNYTAYNALRAAGANPNHPCMQRIIPQNRESFLSSKRVVPTTANSRQAFSYVGDEEFVFSTDTWITLGAILAGASLALIFGLGGGGDGGDDLQYYETSDYNLAEIVGTKVPDSPEKNPYSPIFLLAQNGNTIVNGYYPDYNLGGTNQDGWVISNDSSINVDDGNGGVTSTLLTDLIDFNSSALRYSEYIQTAMKAMNGSTVNNGYASDDPLYISGKNYLITLKNNTTALAAFNNSFANNYSRINVDASNGTIAMIGSVNSTVTNDLSGQINMLFRGSAQNHSIIGMYADTGSTALNQGTIYGQAISSNSSNGTLVGMRGQLINQENPISSKTYVKNTGSITLDGSALNTTINTSLIGMGSWLEDSFLDGTRYLSRAGNIYLENQGSIVLNMLLSGDSGAYGVTSSQLLQGTGGIIGIKSDGNTTATNSGLVQINIDDSGTNTVDGAHAGMLSVHGGNIINNNTIQINGGKGGYGMLSVRGEGSNSEFNNVSPALINSGTISIDSEGGFGMASFNGNSLVNSGKISLAQIGTGMFLQNGVITNSGDISLEEGGIAVSLTGDGTVNNNSSASIIIDAAAPSSSDSSEEGGSDTTEDTVENIGISVNKGTVNNDGIITIKNSGNYTDTTAYAIKTDSANVFNSAALSLSDINTAYGVSVNNGIINNSGLITIGSTSGAIYDTAYALVSQTGNIQNSAQISIDSMNNAYAISSASGNIVNSAVLNINQNTNLQTELAYGIQAQNGSIQNTANINIKNANNSFALSSTNGNLTNSGALTISNPDGTLNETAYGIQILGKGDASNTETALISIDGYKNTYAISSASGNVSNAADININQNSNLQTKLAYGIQAQNGSIQNTANINIKNANNSFALSSTNGNLTNSGALTISNPDGTLNETAYGIQVLGKGDVSNAETALITVDGYNNTYAISSASGNVSNAADININQNSNLQTELAYGIQALNGSIQNTADINIKNANANYGLSSTNGNISNTGAISILNPDSALSETAYGLQVLGKGDIFNAASALISINGSNNAYGISSVSGNIINNANININQSTNVQTELAYGIQAQNGSIQNTADININNVNKGYGLSSNNGNVTNSGKITFSSPSTSLSESTYGIQVTGKGDIINNKDATISINNSNQAYALSAANGNITSDAAISINGNTGASSALAYGIQGGIGNVVSNNTITINNANEGYGISVQNGEVTNNANITLTNSQQTQNKTSYGIYATTGSVINNANIIMDVTGDLSGGIDTDTGSFGIWADQANILNNQNATITFKKRGNGMYSASGSVDNYGTVALEAGGVAMSSASGDIINHENASININNTGIGLQSATGQVTNDGTIEITGDVSTGLSSGNSATNNNSIVINGDNATGMIATADNASLTNNASIEIYTEENSVYNYAMRGADGKFTKLTNNATGTILIQAQNQLAPSENYAYGMYFDSGEAFNYGTITANNIYAYGMYFANGGTIENAKSINLNYGGVGLYGNSSATSETETASLTNDTGATITISGDESYGMQALGVTTAFNKGTIEITGSSSYGLSTKTGSGTNTGSITMNSSKSVGMFSDAADLINDINGTITINGTESVGMRSNSSGSTDTSKRGVVNNGTITLAEGSDKSVGMQIDGEGIGFNNSIITVASDESSGVLAAGDSNITNSVDGQINVSGSGAYGMFAEGDGTATNNGTITVTAADAYALYATGGGTITNNATIKTAGSSALYVDGATANNNADIENNNAGFNAIYATGSSTVNNTATITLNGEGSSAIYIASGSNTEATNSGALNITANNSNGAFVGGGTFTNEAGGQINVGTATASVNQSYGINAVSAEINNNNSSINVYSSSGAGINSSGDSTITNTGTVTVTGDDSMGINTNSGSISNSGSVTVAGDEAIGLNSSSAKIENSSSSSIVTVTGADAIGVSTSTGSFDNSGSVKVSGSTSYGVKTNSGAITNDAFIYADGSNATGVYSETGSITNNGNIYVGKAGASSNVVGIQTIGGSVTNGGYLYSQGSNAIGINVTSSGSVENSRNIQVEGSNAIGIKISGSGGTATNTNTGTISVVGSGAVGMAASDAAEAINEGTIIASGSGAIAMTATSGATATNSDKIYLLDGATLAMSASGKGSSVTNEGTIYYTGSLSGTDGLSAVNEATMTNNGSIVQIPAGDAPSTNLDPVNIVVSQNSNITTNSLRSITFLANTEDMTENKMVYEFTDIASSASAEGASTLAPVLYASRLVESENAFDKEGYQEKLEEAQKDLAQQAASDGTVEVTTEDDKETSLASGLSDLDDYKNYNLVLTKRATSEAVGDVSGVQDTSLYAQIDEAYESGKDGQFFSSIKTSMTSEELVSDIKDEFGLGFFNNFAKQNLDVIRSANRQLNAAVFNNKEDKDIRTMVGYDFSAREQDGDAYSDDYEDEAQSVYAMADMKANETFRYGLGALLTKYSSKYNDDSASRDEIMVQVLAPLTYSPNKSFKIVSIPRIGMGFGDYTRRVDSGTYDGDTKNYYYGITNEARQVIDLGWMAFEPTLEFNVLGMHQDKIDESGALEVEASDSISIEGGVGFYATKLFEFGEAHKLKFRAGGTFYHEFGNPFKAQRARMRDADIYYRLNGYDAGRNRGVVSVRMDYDYNSNFNIYGEFNKFIEDNDAYSVNAGMGYRF